MATLSLGFLAGAVVARRRRPSSTARVKDVASPISAGPTRLAETNLISSTIVVTGDVRSAWALKIEGRVKGACVAPVLSVTSTGAIDGPVAAETLVIAGTVLGDVYAQDLQILAGATVYGRINAANLWVEHGARIDGDIARLPSEVDPRHLADLVRQMRECPTAPQAVAA